MEDKYDSDVDSPYPGAGEGPKGMAVRHLKRYASWVQTVWGLIVRTCPFDRFPHRLNPFEISVVRIRKSANELE